MPFHTNSAHRHNFPPRASIKTVFSLCTRYALRQDESFLFAVSYRHTLIHNVSLPILSFGIVTQEVYVNYTATPLTHHPFSLDTHNVKVLVSITSLIINFSTAPTPLYGWQDQRDQSVRNCKIHSNGARSWSLKYFSDSLRVCFQTEFLMRIEWKVSISFTSEADSITQNFCTIAKSQFVGVSELMVCCGTRSKKNRKATGIFSLTGMEFSWIRSKFEGFHKIQRPGFRCLWN